MSDSRFEDELAARRLRFKHPPEVACVPRRFGVGTLLVVASAYAVLFGALQGLRTPWQFIVAVSVFLTVVGLVQMIVGPKYARRASILLGCAVCVVPVLFLAILNPSRVGDWFMMLMSALAVGGLFGYFAGLAVASVFLFMNMADRWLHPRRSTLTDQPD